MSKHVFGSFTALKNSLSPFLISVLLDVQMGIIVPIDGFRENSMRMWKSYSQKRKAGA